jgi:hypothetical protein
MRKILAERLTGKPCETYHNARHGRRLIKEPYARLAYEAQDRQPGAARRLHQAPDHEVVRLLPGRPDRRGRRCRDQERHPHGPSGDDPVGRLPERAQGPGAGEPLDHGPEWWDFCSFCPDMPEHLRLYIFRVSPDEAYIKTLETEVRGFLLEVQTRYDVLMGNDLKVMAA